MQQHQDKKRIRAVIEYKTRKSTGYCFQGPGFCDICEGLTFSYTIADSEEKFKGTVFWDEENQDWYVNEGVKLSEINLPSFKFVGDFSVLQAEAMKHNK